MFLENEKEKLIDIEKKNIKKSRVNTDRFKAECNENIEEVVKEINELLAENEFTNVSSFWEKNFKEEKGSWSFILNELKQRGYKYNTKEKQFVKEILVGDNIKENSKKENKNEFKVDVRKNNKLVVKSLRIEAGTVEKLYDFFEKYPIYSNGYILSQLLEEALSKYIDEE